jgi:hypothetical protein
MRCWTGFQLAMARIAPQPIALLGNNETMVQSPLFSMA